MYDAFSKFFEISCKLLNLRGIIEPEFVASWSELRVALAAPKLGVGIWSEDSLMEECILQILPTLFTYSNKYCMVKGIVSFLCVRIACATILSCPKAAEISYLDTVKNHVSSETSFKI